jgi:RNA polymerase sigma factor (sigma-70 family)
LLESQSEGAPDPARDVDLEHRRRLLEAAAREHENELSAGVRVYIWRFGLARNHASVKELTQEILQNAFVVALQKLGEYEESRSPIPWLLGIALNVVRHRLRDEIQQSRAYPISDNVPQMGASAQSLGSSEESAFDPAAELEEDTLLEGVATDELLSLVGENDRQVLRLAYIEGLEGKALAARLGISEGAAYTRLSRAMTRLREAYHRANEPGLG